MEQMIWYVIITEIIFFGTRNRTLTGQMTSDIKSGTIAYNMNKPYNYIYYIVSRHLGEITLRFFLYLGIGILIGYHFVGGLAGFQAVNLILIVPVFLLGTLINSFLRMCISILSFWMEDAGPYHWIYDKIIIVVGTLFPVEMFPDWAQPLIKFSPIYVVTYGPAKLVIDFSMEMLWRVLLAQGIYLGITIIIITVMYQKGVKKLNVNGG
jgi:ABC-2 type transport system permease protein